MQFDAQLQSTAAFCDQLAPAKLLSGREATFKPDGGGEEKPVATYVAVEMMKLTELDSETVAHKNGMLGAIYTHRFSLDNWIRLPERSMVRRRDD